MSQSALVENDATKSIAQPAVIITGVRTGGTLLAHCLSNHPDIFCDRAESLHQGSIWHSQLKVGNIELLKCLLHMQGYRISMCKLVYSQVFWLDVWPWLIEQQPRVIWLTRDNTIRQAVSILINKVARSGAINHPQHSFDDVTPIQISLQADNLLATARTALDLDNHARNELSKIRAVLHLTYEHMQEEDGLTEQVGRTVCEFLGVRYVPMTCELKRINPSPLSEIIANWREVRPAIEASEFRACLESE